jgi:hypothetical protein
MLEEIFNGLQSLHFDTLTLSPTKPNWVERWSKAGDNFTHRAHDVCIVH